MPELPEVETTRRGIEPHIKGRKVLSLVIRERRLRWPIPQRIAAQLAGQRIDSVERRAKYLLLRTEAGTAILHLGMSGSLRIVDPESPATKHDHVDIVLDNGKALRLRDPRRFGALLWTLKNPLSHPLLLDLGPEPFSDQFSAIALYVRSRGRKANIKSFLMNSHIVAGVGNIYASEALFSAGIHPARPAGRISESRYKTLVEKIRAVLSAAISQGGTTLMNFSNGDGEPGYFKQYLQVYGREGQACNVCGTPIRMKTIGQRSSFYCVRCQT